MTIRLTIKNLANGTTLRMEAEPDETINDIIGSAGEYWNLDAGAYVLKKGKKLLSGRTRVSDSGLLNDDILEMIPDPEGGCRWGSLRRY
ncbi:MAG: hypothetical protein PUK31_02285 [Candidatus Methanomethylophilaceae archaeon]|nr:hypothetical protein [Candidatus Methanomethylophilaceae archaeon]MDY5871908.1 hypothetical protein [Candidatus Methanomethylophilaceae archaeon]